MTKEPSAKKAPRAAVAARPARKATAPAAAPAEAGGTMLRKRDLVARVAAATGVSRKDSRAVVEAALAEIGAALSRGEGLALPPLGKARVGRTLEKGAGEVLVVKLRRGGGAKGTSVADEALAEADD